MSETESAALKELGRLVAEAIARGEFDLARALTEEAIHYSRAAQSSKTAVDPQAGPAE